MPAHAHCGWRCLYAAVTHVLVLLLLHPQVWLAEWTGCSVAVKELLGFSGSPDDSKMWQEMQNEVHMLGTYNHPNIMRCVLPRPPSAPAPA
jgi:hypothetical protein